jgi:hypothetical protein
VQDQGEVNKGPEYTEKKESNRLSMREYRDKFERIELANSRLSHQS